MCNESRHRQGQKGALRIPDSVNGRLVFSQDRTPKSVRRILPTDTQSPILSLNTVCPYYTMFPLDFPLRRLANANKNEWVLDPFCGRGTTLFAARLLGLGCVRPATTNCPKELHRSLQKRTCELADGGTWNTIAGQPTDDPEMALTSEPVRYAAYTHEYLGWGVFALMTQ